jgi:predicted nucleic acid-binding protein
MTSSINLAKDCWFRLLDNGTPLFTTNYVIVESCALAQHRLGMEAVRAIHEEILPVIGIQWIDEAMHGAAMAALLKAQGRRLSLVDCASFVAMKSVHASSAFAFDQHFIEEGFAFPG